MTKPLHDCGPANWDFLTGRIDFGGGTGYTPCTFIETEHSTWGIKARFAGSGRR